MGWGPTLLCLCHVPKEKCMGMFFLNQYPRGGVSTSYCQCFMETFTRDLAKEYTNKDYQEKEERYNMKNDNQCIL